MRPDPARQAGSTAAGLRFAAGGLFIAGLHGPKTGVRQGVGSLEVLFDEVIFFRQLLERRFVFLQVGAEEAQHSIRRY